MKYVLVALTVLAAAAACGGESTHTEHDQLDDDFKGCPPELPAFGPGLVASGAQHTMSLISAEPSEPERYENDWVVALSQPDAQLLRGQTFMPIHGHDGRIEPVLKPLSEPGQFAVERLNFTMRGPWEVRFWLSSADAVEDYVVFQVCVAK